MIKLTIPGTLPNLNDYIKACRTHYHKGAKLKEEAEQVICIMLRGQLKGRTFGRVQIAFHWYEPNKRRDKDNISSMGRKLILDSLQTLGALTGDGWAQIAGFSDEFYVDKKEPRIEVIVWEVMP